MNQRALTELINYEILRLNRGCFPFSLAFLDIDNFKQVNDYYGHQKGDELLKSVVNCLINNLRKTDVIARMGGDEFSIFYPKTDQDAVKVISKKIQLALNELSQHNNWPTTISMGVVTCTSGSGELDEIVSIADSLMYKIKNAGKNDVLYTVYPEGKMDSQLSV